MRPFVTTLLLICTGHVTAGDDWNQWGGPGRQFATTLRLSDIDTKAKPKLAWITPLEIGNSGVTVRSDRVVTMGRRGEQEVVCCFGLTDGKLQWSFGYDAELPDFIDTEFGSGPHATPLLGEESSFASSASGMASSAFFKPTIHESVQTRGQRQPSVQDV